MSASFLLATAILLIGFVPEVVAIWGKCNKGPWRDLEVGCGLGGTGGLYWTDSGWATGFPNWMDILDEWLLGLHRSSLTEADVWSWKSGFFICEEVKEGSVGWTLGNVLGGFDSVWPICVFGISKYFSPGATGALELRDSSEAMLSGLRDKQMKIRVMN